MSWLFSQVLVVEYLGANCLDGEQSVQSNGKPIQQAYCAPDKMTKFSRLSRFGMMYKPLTESLGKELLMSFLEDFHAKTLVQPGGGLGSPEKEVQCGNTWQELLGKYNPDTALWKTAQCSLLEDLEQSLEIWPRWGSMRNGECYRQPMLAQITLESGFGLSERIPNNIDFFHTPCTTGIDGGSNSRKALKKRMETYPTPNAGMYRNLNYNKELCFKRAEKHQTDLAMVSVMQFGGQLNPAWAEWLMGWPMEWTDLKPLETDKCHFVQQQLGTSLKED
jgi:hypothetical protein